MLVSRAKDCLRRVASLNRWHHGARSPLSAHARTSWHPYSARRFLLAGNAPHCGALAAATRTRGIHFQALLMPPLYFTGLLVALWVWKCTMMVVFQNKIIYMPSLPPGTRSEEISDYARDCLGIRWEEVQICAVDDNTRLVLAVASTAPKMPVSLASSHVYLLYLQGNAASTPPRLPTISAVLRAVLDGSEPSTRHTAVCVGYRGFWKSAGRPSEIGINRDVTAALKWVSEVHANTYADASVKPIVILWGHSIGAGFATNLAARLAAEASRPENVLPIDSLVLETAFLSTRAMLGALYPHKLIPYRYLWPFLRNHLDSWSNLGTVSLHSAASGRRSPPGVFLLVAEKDEIVPRHHGEQLQQRCRDLGIPVEYQIVGGAYHNEASFRAHGRQAIANFILARTKEAIEPN